MYYSILYCIGGEGIGHTLLKKHRSSHWSISKNSTTSNLEYRGNGADKKQRTSRENRKYNGRNVYDLTPLIQQLETLIPVAKDLYLKDKDANL